MLNLETDDGTFQDDPKTVADLSGTLVEASQPVAVFSGTETAGAPGAFEVPTPPGWQRPRATPPAPVPAASRASVA